MENSVAPVVDYASPSTGKLFDPKAVTLATFLGSPICGGIVLAMNYRQLGRNASANKAVVLSLLGTIVLFAIGMVVPDKTPKPLLYLPPILAMAAIAKALQGQIFEEHKRLGGAVRSLWAAAGIGLVGLVVIVGIVIAVVYGTTKSPGTRLVVGTKDEIFYSGTATASEAKALGDTLKTLEFFTDRGVSVVLSKGGAGTSVSFVVSDGAWDRPENVKAFESIGRAIAPQLGGFPLTVKLMTAELTVKKEILVSGPN